MSVSAASSNVHRLVGERPLDHGIIRLHDAIDVLMEGNNWQLERMAQLTILAAQIEEQFMIARRVSLDNPWVPPQLILADKTASEMLLNGRTPEEIRASKLGTWMRSDTFCGPLWINVLGPSAPHTPEAEATNPYYISLDIEREGDIVLSDVSPPNVMTVIRANWSGAFAELSTMPNADEDSEQGAQILTFPS